MSKYAKVIRSLSALSKRRENVFVIATATLQSLERPGSITPRVAQRHLERVKELRREFENIQNQIITMNATLEDAASAVETTQAALDFEELVWNIQEKAEEYKPSPVLESAPPAATSTIPLAPMQIPSFDGAVSIWPEFKALFDQLIHNNPSLTNVQKFYYLKTLVTGDAAKLIASIEISNDNYFIAYTALTKRYASRRRLANRYMCEILHFKASGKESEFLSTHQNAVEGLKIMNLPDLADYVLFRNCYENLNPRMQYLFDDRCDPQNVPTCSELSDFLLHHTQNAELRREAEGSAKAPPKAEGKNTTAWRRNPKTFLTQENTKIDSLEVTKFPDDRKVPIVCPVCQSPHLIYSCTEFLRLQVQERRDLIKRLERCFNCLGQHHVRLCRSQKTCAKCQLQHHSFLHLESEATVEDQTAQASPRCHFLNAESTAVVLLGTFLAQIKDCKGEYHQIRCVMDTGSHVSAISKPLARRLGIKPRRVNCAVSGLASSTSNSKEMIHIALRSCQGDQQLFHFPAYVFSQICHELPSQRIKPTQLDHIRDLQLADPYYNEPSAVDLLLSAELSAAILSTQTPNLIVGQPTAVRTAFGWVLFGSVPVSQSRSPLKAHALLTLEDNLQRFWEIEELPERRFESPEEEWCETHFQRTHSHDDSGRYMVALPFRPDCASLGTNRDEAMKRWVQLEKKLSAAPLVKATYNATLRDYLENRHMEIARTPSSYILPHHAVTKLSSTTKLRVVFDASAQDSSGLSLNDRLFPGPKFQTDLTRILSSFRSSRFALCGDISQMYRRIWLHPSDRYCQHIFWRDSPDSDVREFELRTLTFGLASAPYLVQRVLHQLAQDEGSQYDLAVKALKYHTYIDDVIMSVDTIEEGKTMQKQLIELLAKGGFHLRKWCSNAQGLLMDIPPEDLETPLEFEDGSQQFKVLGLFWNPRLDVFTYHVQPFTGRITKRTILSFVARVYDPMGWLAPVLVVAKYFLQRLWLLNLDWDADVPKLLREQWSEFSRLFEELSLLQIPRELSSAPGKTRNHYRLIGFCNASETAYAACVYLQNASTETAPLVLLQAKTKVAPLKPKTIACLELCGALLLIRLVKSMSIPFPVQEIAYFTDSTIVLTWLHTPLHRLKTFVANRVAQILESSKFSQWNHIAGVQNPADLASRGLHPKELLQSTQWWSGPSTIICQKDPVLLDESATPELKTPPETYSFFVRGNDNMIGLIEKFSSWTGLRKTIAWTLRFIHNCRHLTMKRLDKGLLVEEYEAAAQRVIFLTQQHYFISEIVGLRNGKIPRSLLSLQPFLDSSGCIRVGGRLEYAPLPFKSKHPLLIPKTSHLAVLLIRHFHEASLHSGPSTIQALIQQEFWIPSLRNLIRKFTFQCIPCHRLKASVLQPKMGNLPVERVTASRPFSNAATDFAGPFSIKESAKRHARVSKCYLCIFVCMATKAVHLEVVTALTTEAFLAAFIRFSCRRGLPALMVSDNGKNFVGAARELKELQIWLQENEDRIGASLATKSVRWKFNPPEAPNFGGLFEAAIKSTKLLLHRMVGATPLTLEELSTLFSRVEAVLNSRPITRLSTDPQEDYLAPSHFLVGGLLHQVPELPLEEPSLNSRWKRVQQLGQAFWKRWSQQYLQQLLPRTRWQKDNRPIKEGDLVYIKNHNTSPLTWPLGRVTETCPGKDGIVRVVSVRTSSGSYVRPTNKLIPLPLQD